jgi:hypothetical protein
MDEEQLMKRKFVPILLIILGSITMGMLIQTLLPVGDFWQGVSGASSLLFLVLMILYLVWLGVGRGKKLAWMMLLAFILRLGLGIFLAWGLPQFGYDEPPQQAGFVFQDAFRRESSAWELAQSGEPLAKAFSDEYTVDQYGGLLAMDAFVYRFLSPDAYRPGLIIILSAAAGALSLPFLTAFLGRIFGRRAALWGGWVLALYPEGILLGAAQMREPFLILFFSILTWSVAQILDGRRQKLAIPFLIGSAASLFLFSIRVAIPLLGIVLLWIWVEESARIKRTWLKTVIWIGGLTTIIALIWFYQDWVREIISWDARLTLIASGRIQFELESLPTWLHIPFIIGYGIFQPVLPAAIAAPAPWIWRGLGIFRALGWYALLPLLAYAIIKIIRLPSSRKKRWLMIIIIFVWVWIFIASARAGGDQWDNPRYRTIFLPWMAIIAGWAVNFVREHKDRWLGQALLIEGIFLSFFTEWYISRYYPVIPRLNFWLMILLILILSMAVVLIGWYRDRKGKV